MKAYLSAAAACALAALAFPVSAQDGFRLPSMCVCKSSAPNSGLETYWMNLETSGNDFAALKARLAEMDYRPMGRIVSVSSICPITRNCREQDKLSVNHADLKVKITGWMADKGLVVDDKVQSELFVPGAWLVLSGEAE